MSTAHRITPATMTPRVSYAAYGAIRAVNWSSLKHLRESPAHYLHAFEAPRVQTDSMVLGSATHTAILEPHRWEEEVAVWEGGRRSGKEYTAWKEAHADRLQIRHQDLPPILAMQDAVHSHPVASDLLAQGEAEVTIQWTDEETGLACKGRVDWLIVEDDRAVLVDLKTTRATCPRRFASQAAKLGYHCQLAHYRAGVAAATGLPPSRVEVYIVAVESSAPHDVVAYLLDDDTLYPGEEEVRELLALLRRCHVEGRWPGRAEDVQRLELPAWVFPSDDDEADDLGITIGGA